MSVKTGVAVALLAGTVLGTAAVAGGLGRAEGPGLPGHGGADSFGLLGRLDSYCALAKIALGLSDAQDQQIKAILASHREEFLALVERLHTIRESVSQAARQENVDETLIRERVQEATGPLADLAVLHAKVHHEVGAVLTPEQRKKAEALHDVLRSHRGLFRKAIGERLRELFGERS
jgi:Spy/CpxP family protein refolding chaperone